VNFTLVLKFDTFDRDQRYLVERSHLGDVLPGNLDPINLGLNVGKGVRGKSRKWKTDDYISRLDPDAMKGLCQLYQYDFQIFGFSHEKCPF
jgi:hypothetical protein